MDRGDAFQKSSNSSLGLADGFFKDSWQHASVLDQATAMELVRTRHGLVSGT